MNSETKQTVTNKAAETVDLGEKLGAKLQGGEVIDLASDLGGGKTTFVKGLAKGLNSEDRVASPTFVLSKQYRGREGLTLYHYDFYRLDNAGVMQSELAEKLGDKQAIIVIEWSQAVAEVLPSDHLQIQFEARGDKERLITWRAFGDSYVRLIQDLGEEI